MPNVVATSRRLFLLLSFSVFLPFFPGAGALAGTHVQTDWSGGPNVQGPVTEWSDTFQGATQTSWRSVPGQLAITSVPVDPTIDVITDTAPACRSVAWGDLDGDGDLDLMTALALTSFPGTGKVRWYENAGDGVTWTEHEVDSDFYGGWGITAGDIDGDGDLDIVASAFYGNPEEDGRYVWYENLHGDASAWLRHDIAGNLYGTQMAAVADMDGDGDLDIYGCSTLTYIGSLNDDIYWFENVKGDGSSWIQHRVADNIDDAIEVAAGDIDGDGDLDLAGTSYAYSNVFWWENVGGDALTWVTHVVASGVDTNNAVAVADLDDDGDLDIAATGVQSLIVAWFENADGHGGSWIGHLVGYINGGRDVAMADLDGDGRLDVLSAGISSVLWYRNLGGGGAFASNLITYIYSHEGYAAIPPDINGDGALEVVFTEEGQFAGDISGLFRSSITQFGGAGSLESLVLDAGAPTTWNAIGWDATVPAQTTLSFQVRSSNDPLALGPWSANITQPGSLSGILAPGTRYMQYKVVEASADPQASPIVREVSLDEANPASAPEEEAAAGPAGASVTRLEAPWPNPSPGVSTARFVLATTGLARIDILDVRGRLVSTPLLDVLTAGTHQVVLPRLAPGIYLVRLSAQGSSEARKVVVR